MTAPLETRALGKRFRRGWALRDCSLTLPEGAIVGLAGPNGAGKSTLLELAVALLAPTEGEIRVLGRDPRARPVGARGDRLRRAGRAALPLVHGRARRSSSRARRTRTGTRRSRGELLDRLPAGRRVSSLSAGERSRLALASRSASGRRCCSSTSRSRGSTRSPRREFLQMLMDGVADDGRDRRHRVARDRRHRARRRPHRPAQRRARSAGGRRRGAARVAPAADAARAGRSATIAGVARDRPPAPQRAADDAARAARRHPVVDPSWSVDEIGLEELLLAYMAPERLPSPQAREKGRLRWHG